MVLEDGAELRGAASGSVLRAAADFHGRALIVVRGNHVLLRDFTVDGNREKLESRLGLPAYDVPFARFTPGNGVLADGVRTSDDPKRTLPRDRGIRRAGEPVAAGFDRSGPGGRQRIAQPGGAQQYDRRHSAGRGHQRFPCHPLRAAQHSGQRDLDALALHLAAQRARRLRGKSLRHHRPRRPAGGTRHRGARGRKYRHAHRLTPEDMVDAQPVGIDTAGNVDRSLYTRNQFSIINGKCIDLDGFHDGEVSHNVCVGIGGFGIVMNNTNPDMQSRNVRIEDNRLDGVKYGGIFVIGERQHDPAQSPAESEYRALRLLLHGRRAGHVPQRNLPGKRRGAPRPRTRQSDRGKRNHRLSNGPPLHRRGAQYLSHWNVVRGNRCR